MVIIISLRNSLREATLTSFIHTFLHPPLLTLSSSFITKQHSHHHIQNFVKSSVKKTHLSDVVVFVNPVLPYTGNLPHNLSVNNWLL